MRTLGLVAVWLIFAAPLSVYALGVAAPDMPEAGYVLLVLCLAWAGYLARTALGKTREQEGGAPVAWWQSGHARIVACAALIVATGWTLSNSGAPWYLVRRDYLQQPVYPLLHWLAPETTPGSAQVRYLRTGIGGPSGGVRISPAFSEIDSVNWSPDGEWLLFRGHRYMDRTGYSQGWYYLASSRGGRAKLLMRPPEHTTQWSCYWSPNSDEICFLNLGDLNDTTLVSVPDGSKRKIGMKAPPWWSMLPGVSPQYWNSFPQKPTTTAEYGAGGRVYRCGDKCAWASQEPLSPLGEASKMVVFALCAVAAPWTIAAGVRSLRRSRKDGAAWVQVGGGVMVWGAFVLGILSFLLSALTEAFAHMM